MINRFFSESSTPPEKNGYVQSKVNGNAFEEKESSSQERNRPDIYKSYMLVRATVVPPLTENLDLKAYLTGEKDIFFQDGYNNACSLEFFDPKHPNQKFAGRPYTVYSDLAQLVKEKCDRIDLGASDKFSYVLCFDNSSKDVYSAISKGELHKIIVKAINHRDLYNWYYREKCKVPFHGEIVDANEFRNSISDKTANASVNTNINRNPLK